MIQFTILGQCYSMKNSKREMHINGKFFKFKHPKAVKFEKDFIEQCPTDARKRLSGPLRSVVTVFYPSKRQDLDCGLVYDLLQKANVIENDRQIIEKHEYRAMDKDNPRVEIIVEEL